MDIVGRDGGGEDDAAVVVVLLDGGGQDAADADTVATHGDGLLFAFGIEKIGAQRLTEKGAQLEDVAYLDAAGRCQWG